MPSIGTPPLVISIEAAQAKDAKSVGFLREAGPRAHWSLAGRMEYLVQMSDGTVVIIDERGKSQIKEAFNSDAVSKLVKVSARWKVGPHELRGQLDINIAQISVIAELDEGLDKALESLP